MLDGMGTSVSEIAATLRASERRRRAQAEARAQRLLRDVPRARELLRSRYAVARVVLFGSLATGDVSPRSDVDLAVLGLEPARYFDALADLMELFGSPVDLVRIEEAPTSLRERIAAEGKEA